MAARKPQQTYTPSQVAGMVQTRCNELGGKQQAAAHWSISWQMVHYVCSGKRPPTKAMLDELGLEAVKPVVEPYYRRKA